MRWNDALDTGDGSGNGTIVIDVGLDRVELNVGEKRCNAYRRAAGREKLADVITEADKHESGELKLVLMNVADAGRDLSANRLAAFLSRYADRLLAGFKFVNRKGHAGTKMWRLEKVP